MTEQTKPPPSLSTSSSSSVPEITSIRLPSFWANSPNSWFIQAEALFENGLIRSERSKYSHLLASMPPEVLEKVIDIIQTPPDENRYTYLKTVLLERLSASEESG
ncbi:uncharacterized protein LOC100888426 [Anopheles sinensis]|uniref:Uncharacterized protein LOC100888426 n=1 Tax=Anopheles sinensis TaxID=74873 RepID=A0A084VBD8_ANOSI|nr:uncharacterized protein LOC100888426 [Anopheles sinensis]